VKNPRTTKIALFYKSLAGRSSRNAAETTIPEANATAYLLLISLNLGCKASAPLKISAVAARSANRMYNKSP
jgi:hypothetical protein